MQNVIKSLVFPLTLFWGQVVLGQSFEGVVLDSESMNPLSGVEVILVEDNLTAVTDEQGRFSLMSANGNEKTLRFVFTGYMFEELYHVLPANDIQVILRERKKSAATLREEGYISNADCSVDNPADPEWNIAFETENLKGDLAPDPFYTRRDPSAVIQVDGTYYVWYSYSLTDNTDKTAPWDLNDLYFATSTDGETWTEQGAAVTRGPEGSFDHRSVFTTEIFVHNNKYYLVYQAAADQDGVYNRNFIGMAYADSPDGPWTKLEDPVLRPTYTDDLWFDNNAVHDPTLVHFNDKFYLYYKGECNCMGEAGCRTWCNPVCGLGKQVKWGVAIADDPTGPFTKSEFNPITNTGHELIIWEYNDGLAILQHQDGPEANTIQYSSDGINFEIQGTVNNIPEAAGLYRPNEQKNTPHGGVDWGLSHVLRWDSGPNGWMHIQRFTKKDGRISDMFIVQDTIYMNVSNQRTLTPIYEPYDATQTGVTWTSADEDIVSVDASGLFVANQIGCVKLKAQAINGNYSDSVIVKVTANDILMAQMTVQAEQFSSTNNLDGLSYGGPLGVNRNGLGINFVNRNDWADYEVNVPFSGQYYVNYRISTPTDGAQVQIRSGEKVLNQQDVFNNGQWDSYYRLNGTNSFYLEKGQQVIRLFASGSNDWQWNMDAFELIGEAEQVEITPELESLVLTYDSAFMAIDSVLLLTAEPVPTEITNLNLHWDSTNPQVASVTNGKIQALAPGTTDVVVTDLNTEISAKIVVSVYQILSLAHTGLDIPLVFPNPVNTILYLESQEQEVRIIDSGGKVHALDIIREGNLNAIDVRSLPKGVYYLIIESQVPKAIRFMKE
ncbi:MAG: family 43 glycosylhydrolase [Bacteroidota bacterium]